MSEIIKTGWLKNNEGEKFAPKTLISQIQDSDGNTLESKLYDITNEFSVIVSEGTGDAYTATVPGITELKNGVSFIMKAHDSQNFIPGVNGLTPTVSVANPTLDVNNLGPKEIRMFGNLNPNTSLLTTQNIFIPQGAIMLMIYQDGYWNAQSLFNLAGQLLFNNPGSVRTWEWDGKQAASDVSKSWIVPTEYSFITNISKLAEEKDEIAWGSNDDGQYYKFKNGLLICTKRVTVSSPVYSQIKQDFSIIARTSPQALGNWAYTFIDEPTVNVSMYVPNTVAPNLWLGSNYLFNPDYSDRTTIAGFVTAYSTVVGNGPSFELEVIGIGKWAEMDNIEEVEE